MRLLAAVATLAFALSAAAQAPPAGAIDPLALMDEARVLQTTLEAVQARALQDESLGGKADALVRDVEARMAEIDPQTNPRLAQLEQLRQAADRAAAAEDRAAFDSTLIEARAVQEALEATRGRVLEEESYLARTVALQRELVDTMTVIEPRVPEMLRRLAELARLLGSR